MNNLKIGFIGQSKAENYLKSCGYKILNTNFRTKQGEIDIIAKEGDQLVFIEVKYRLSNKFGWGFEAVGNKKLRSLRKTIDIYLQKNNLKEACRIDVVSIDGDKIRLFKNV